MQEARRREESFIGNLSGAQDDYEWIVENRAWVALGWDSFADWWVSRIQPIMRALSMRPTREIAAAVIEQVRQEEADLPPAQRRTQRELAAMVGVERSTLANRDGSRSLSGESAHRSDLDGLNAAERESLAEAENVIDAGLQALDSAILYALSNRVDPALIVGWLTAAQHRLSALDDGEGPSLAVQVVFEPRIKHLLRRGKAITDELAGRDIHRKPLTEDELAALASTISGGTA